MKRIFSLIFISILKVYTANAQTVPTALSVSNIIVNAATLSWQASSAVPTANTKVEGFKQPSPAAGTNYYKLQQVDFNGDIKELGIRTVDFRLGSSISLYPNPVVDKATIVFDAGYQTIELMNESGGVLQRINIAYTDTSREISLANYSSAVYFIKLIGVNKTDIQKVIKQ